MPLIDDVLRVANDWCTNYPAMEMFADTGIIIDLEHRENLVDEIQERIDQCEQHKSDLQEILEDQPILESFLKMAKNTELVVDFRP